MAKTSGSTIATPARDERGRSASDGPDPAAAGRAVSDAADPAAAGRAVSDAADPAAAGRPMRADARRNYQRLVDAARDVFGKFGSEASMEAIAKQAGVGVGTLYRHFPKRIDVVEAVYRDDVDELVAAAERAVETLGPWEALDSWLHAFVRYAQAKRILIAELQESFDKNPGLKLASRERISKCMDLILSNAQAAGAARTDVDGDDLVALVGPMCTHATLSEDQSNRLITMIIDGLRPQADPVRG